MKNESLNILCIAGFLGCIFVASKVAIAIPTSCLPPLEDRNLFPLGCRNKGPGEGICSHTLWTYYETVGSRAWMCDGNSVSNDTGCVSNDTGGCCWPNAVAVSCPTPSCPCPWN